MIKYGETRINFQCERNLMEWLLIWTTLILFPHTSILLVRKLCCISLKTTKQWSRWSNGRSPTMRHVSRTDVALDWLFDGINLDPKKQTKDIHTKNQLADILTKGNFTLDEWNHLLCLFNINNFKSINSVDAMSKRTQENVGEEWITAKSKPMMNLVSDTVRGIRTCLPRLHRKAGENQIWKSERTSELVECAANKYGETCDGR